MSYAADVQASTLPLSAQFRDYFNEERIDSWPEGIRSAARGVIIWTEQTMQMFEREIERLQTEDGAVVDLLRKIGFVALGVLAACCNPLAALAGAAVGLIFGDKIQAGLHTIWQIFDQSPFLKITALVAGIIVACFAPQACLAAAFTALAFAGASA